MEITPEHLIGSTYSYDIQGAALNPNVQEKVITDDDANSWFFVYGGYSH